MRLPWAELVFGKTSLWCLEHFARGYATTPVTDDFSSLDFGSNTFLGFLAPLELLISSDAMPTCQLKSSLRSSPTLHPQANFVVWHGLGFKLRPAVVKMIPCLIGSRALWDVDN